MAKKTITELKEKLIYANFPDEEIIISEDFGNKNIFDELLKERNNEK